jgi:hypothetical protein
MELILFTPQDVDEAKRRVRAHIYNPATKRWMRSWTSFPHLIFDRCRKQNSERYAQLLRFREKYRSIPFLNRPLRNKWIIHETLSEDPDIRVHLPACQLFSEYELLPKFLKAYGLVYIKPIDGTGGRGIVSVERLNSGLCLLKGRGQKREIIPAKQLTMDQLKEFILSNGLLENHLLHQGIRIALDNGRVHDYRMLIQKNGIGKWEVTGCACRVGANESVTSNLHGGGQAFPMTTMLKQWLNDERKVRSAIHSAERLAHRVVERLEQQYGRICELALDLAVDREGHVWLLEVNDKPAREVFRQAGELKTYRQTIARPLEYALWLYRQHESKQNRGRSESV